MSGARHPHPPTVFYLDRVPGGWRYEIRTGVEVVATGVRPFRAWAKRTARRRLRGRGRTR